MGKKGNIIAIRTLIEDRDYNHVVTLNYPFQLNVSFCFPVLGQMNIVRETIDYHMQ